ncbi:MAG: hypothetical protein PHT07_09965 [Paludibacter sp.]|nr:hypothetical protein [Paludibacter sp.]
MNMTKIFVIMSFLVLNASLEAACCTCADQYADMAARLVKLQSAVSQATASQVKESAELKKMVAREGMVLAFEKKRSETVAETKAIDSAGFALVLSRHRAEKSVTTAERMRMILKGYDLSDQEVGDILKTVGQ